MRFAFVLIIALLTACSSSESNLSTSPQFDGKKFQNQIKSESDRGLLSVLKFLIFENNGVWPENIDNKATPELKNKPNESVLTFINHATFLAEMPNQRILFDPIFSERASPVSWAGPKRKRAPGLAINALPKIDVILISHNHYDHLDLASLKYLSKRDNPLILVPLGNKAFLTKEGIANVIEMDWWDKISLDKEVVVTFVPAQHFSGRGLFDRDKSLWGGFVVQTPRKTLFHAGDTGYSPHFSDIGEKYDIDIAMLPIGDYAPRWFLEYVHMDPIQAIKAHKDLNAKQSIVMHAETFQLSQVSYNEPQALLKELNDIGKKPTNFITLEIGQSIRISND